jgi:uncharacterized protein YjbJ (UPF0337 family)
MADAMENIRNALRTKFDKLTPEDFSSVQGNKDGLIDKVAEKYSITKEEATKQVEETLASAK